MKGFARILESIIASIVIIASLTFFFSLESPQSGWDSTSLQIISQDVLQALYLNGSLEKYVNNGDTVSLNNDVSNLLPNTVDFSLSVKGIPNNIIRIACVDCSSAMLNELSLILNKTEFSYNKRPISIRVETISLATETIKDETDILFFFDKAKVETYRAKIDAFMKKDGNIFLLGNPNQTDAQGYLGGIFNLTWIGANSQNTGFYDILGSQNISHYVAKYYANISGKNIADSADAFTAFESNGIRAVDRKTIIVGVDGVHAYVHANPQVNGTSGRAVWFSDYTRVNHEAVHTQMIDRLLKASLMWASGERYSMDASLKTPANENFVSEIQVFSRDAFIVELTIWRVFF